MSVLWLHDGVFYRDYPDGLPGEEFLPGSVRFAVEGQRKEPTQPATPTQEKQEQPSLAYQDSLVLTPEAHQRGALALPIPPPNSEIAAQPQFTIEGVGPAQDRGIDPVAPVTSRAGVPSGADQASPGQYTPVRRLMSSPAITVGPETSVATALETLKSSGCHHLPVVDSKQRLVGMVSDRDLLGRSGTVKERMKSQVLTASQDTELREVAQALVHERFHSLVVIDDQHCPVGVVTSYDLLRFLVDHPALELWRSQSQTSTGAQ